MTERLSLQPGHRIRAGQGLDSLDVRATGRGLLLGAAGLRWVWGRWQGVVFRRFRTGSAWALFVGLHGVAFARAQLGPVVTVRVPPDRAKPPRVPGAASSPRALPPDVPGPFPVPDLVPTPEPE